MSRVLTTANLRCPVTGKSAYLTEKKADQIVAKSKNCITWRNEHGDTAKNAYLCHHCDWWHLTKRKKNG